MPVKKESKTTTPSPDWGAILDSLSNDGGSNFLFPKGNRTRVRLLQGEGQPPFTTVDSNYQGNIKTKYLMPCIQPDADGDDAEKVKAMIVPKTVFRAVVQLATEGYDLWDPTEGYGITILRQGSGLETTYSVMPSKNPIPIDHSFVDEVDIDQMVKDYEEFQKRSSKKETKEDDSNSDY